MADLEALGANGDASRAAFARDAPPAPTPFVPTPALVEAADEAARHWKAADRGPVALGSELHKKIVCRMFHETFNPYKPSIIDWPKLSTEATDRLIKLPIWDIAVQTEGKAQLRMQAFGRGLSDPDWRRAIELNAWEEGRHKEVLSNLVAAYGIQLEPEPIYRDPRDAEWAYLVTGFSECVDSFFAFGLFEVAKRSGFFPPELVDTFEPVIQEEARHILLFANWLAWHRRSLPIWRRPLFELRVAAVWLFLAWERVGTSDNNFTLNGSKAVSDVEISPAALMAICLEENDRRFLGYDSRLIRPTTTPAIARLFCRFAGRRGARGKAQTP